MNILKLPAPLLLLVGCRHEFCVPTIVSFRASFCAGISFFALFLLSTFVDTINEKEFFCLKNFFTSWLFLASQIASETSKKWFFMALVASLCTVGRRTEWTTNGRRMDDGRTTEGRMEMASVAGTSAYWAPCPRTTNHITNYENAFHGEDQNTNEIKIHLSLESNVTP